MSHAGTGSVDARDVAERVLAAFDDYHARFAAITRRAKPRFERQQWVQAQDDAVERIALYDRCIAATLEALQAGFGASLRCHEAWRPVRLAFARCLEGRIDAALCKTFFNTLTRRLFATHGVDPAIEFVAFDVEPSDAITHPVARRTYTVSALRPSEAFMRVLGDYRFAVPYAHPLRCAAAIAVRLQDDLAYWGPQPVRSIELLDTVFYRERRAYLVGRVFGEHRFSPCVIALTHDAAGLRADAVLTRRRDVAHLFGVSRSYFQADLATVGDAVVFLRSLLPGKPVDELYTVLGRAKQGKTERYRTFFSHFRDVPSEQLVRAEGTPGMVMAVFTLPSYPLVFKLIRDRFAWPKAFSRQQVEEKYTLVFNLDRVGRLLDAQPYRHLRFPAARFTPALLEELTGECSQSVRLVEGDVEIALCYVQRRLRPLDLYLREQGPEAVRAAVLDYAQAITDMARSNIFPGDMLPKNFGVSRHGRAVFYDYDEVSRVSECVFRDWPAPRSEEDAMADEPWFHVGPQDVFPARFGPFMGLPAAERAAVREHFGHLFDPAWWRGLQAGFAAGTVADVPPYTARQRLA